MVYNKAELIMGRELYFRPFIRFFCAFCSKAFPAAEGKFYIGPVREIVRIETS